MFRSSQTVSNVFPTTHLTSPRPPRSPRFKIHRPSCFVVKINRYIPLLVLLLAAGWLLASLRKPENTTAFDLEGFGRLPVLVNGRIKPLDTVARTSLLMMQGRQRVSDPTISDPFVASPTE